MLLRTKSQRQIYLFAGSGSLLLLLLLPITHSLHGAALRRALGPLVIWWSLVIQVSASSTPALGQSWGDEEKIEPTCCQEIALFPTLVDCWWWESGEARPHHQPRHPPPSLKGGARPWTSTVTKDPNLDWIALVAVTTILIQIPLLIYHPRVQQIFVKTK